MHRADGSGGHGLTGEALTAAMSSQLGGIGGCNGGFLRKDALLMISIISNWDQGGHPWSSAGTPEEWAHAIIDRKNGNLDAVVMLYIGDATFPWQDRLWRLTPMFKHNLISDGWDPDYGPAFDTATDMALDACAGFVPPG